MYPVLTFKLPESIVLNIGVNELNSVGYSNESTPIVALATNRSKDPEPLNSVRVPGAEWGLTKKLLCRL